MCYLCRRFRATDAILWFEIFSVRARAQLDCSTAVSSRCYVDAIFFPLFMLQIDCFMPGRWWRFGFRFFFSVCLCVFVFFFACLQKQYRTVTTWNVMWINCLLCFKCDKNALTILCPIRSTIIIHKHVQRIGVRPKFCNHVLGLWSVGVMKYSYIQFGIVVRLWNAATISSIDEQAIELCGNGRVAQVPFKRYHSKSNPNDWGACFKVVQSVRCGTNFANSIGISSTHTILFTVTKTKREKNTPTAAATTKSPQIFKHRNMHWFVYGVAISISHKHIRVPEQKKAQEETSKRAMCSGIFFSTHSTKRTKMKWK